MKKLPEGYKQLEYIKTGEPELYYLSGFKTMLEAQTRTNELYNKYPYQQQSYTVLAQANPVITDYAVRFPAKALSFLTTEEQKRATPILSSNIHPIHYSPMVYRFLDEKYIDDFFNDGSLMLSTYERCKKLEDEKRRDEQEGENTIVKTEGTFKVVIKAGIGYNPLLLCTSLYQTDVTREITTSKFCLEIKEPQKFAEAVAQELVRLGHYVIDTYIGPCCYSNKTIEGYGDSASIELFLKESERSKTINPEFFNQIIGEVAGQHMYFNKPLKFVHENEYRFIWIVNYDPKDKPVFIKVPEATKYCRKICLG